MWRGGQRFSFLSPSQLLACGPCPGWSWTTTQLCLPGPVLRPFTAIGLCRNINQSCSSPQISCRTASGSGQQDKMSSSGSWTNTDSLSICGSALGRRWAAITPGMTPKHSHRPTERRSKAASAFYGHAAKEPLPLLVGSSTHLFPKKLMKVCSSAAPRPPRRFHTACSQTLSRPVVTAHLHWPLRRNCSASAAHLPINACPEQQKGPQMDWFPQNHC